MLQRADVTPWWNRLADSATGVSAVTQTEPSACRKDTAFPSDRHRLAARIVSYNLDEPETGEVRETVVRYQPGWGTEAMAEARRVLTACHVYVETLSATDRFEIRYRLERTLAGVGDDALLIRRDSQLIGATRVWSMYLTLVRVGDAVLTTVHELGEGGADADVAVTLAGAGARRAACLRSTC